MTNIRGMEHLLARKQEPNLKRLTVSRRDLEDIITHRELPYPDSNLTLSLVEIQATEFNETEYQIQITSDPVIYKADDDDDDKVRDRLEMLEAESNRHTTVLPMNVATLSTAEYYFKQVQALIIHHSAKQIEQIMAKDFPLVFDWKVIRNINAQESSQD